MPNRRTIIAAMIFIVGLVFSMPAFASSPASGKKPGVGESDHWSVVDYVFPESKRAELRKKLGVSWKDGSPFYRLAHTVITILVILLIIFLVTLARPRLNNPEDALIPEKKLTAYTFLELFMEQVNNMGRQIMGEKYARRALPLIGTLALFIFFGNLMALVPGLLPATDNFNTTLACGLVVFVMYNYWGIREHGAAAYFKHFLGPITSWYALPLMMLMLVIELISHTVRPISLGIRLMGNMFGDHAVLSNFLGFEIPLLPLPIMALGLLVIVVQTLVFCLLSMVYIGLATAHSDH